MENSLDAGQILEGVVTYDDVKAEYVLKSDDGEIISIQDLLRGLTAKKVRITCISFEAIANIERILAESGISTS